MPAKIWARARNGSVLHYWVTEDETLCGYLMLTQCIQHRLSKVGVRECGVCRKKRIQAYVDEVFARDEP